MGDLDILEMKGRLTADNAPAYYKYRLTFSEEYSNLEDQKRLAKCIVQSLKHYMLSVKYTAAIEHYTKCMAECKPHLHVHFMSNKSSDTIRKGLNKQFNFKGRRPQACIAEILVDENKFWRYPLKQQTGSTFRWAKTEGFTEDEIKNMVLVSNQCWKQAAEVAIKKVEKREAQTTQDRLYDHLDTLQYIDFEELKVNALEWYVQACEVFNNNTLMNYLHFYILSRKHISYREYAREYLK